MSGYLSGALKGARRLRTEPVKPMDVGPAEPAAPTKGYGRMMQRGKKLMDRRQAKRLRRGA